MALREICRGRWGNVVFAVLAKDACPAADFIATLDGMDKAKLKALFQRFSDHGFINNREKFKKVADDLFEFKSFRVRMFCYIRNRQLVITHGVIKKRDESTAQNASETNTRVFNKHSIRREAQNEHFAGFP